MTDGVVMKPGDEGRLAHWRGQQKELTQMLDDLPLHSIARPALEKDLAVATEIVVHYQELEAKGGPETDPA
jgi:hypothetical protein